VKLAGDSVRSEARLQDTLVTVDEVRRLAGGVKRRSVTKASMGVAVTRMVGR